MAAQALGKTASAAKPVHPAFLEYEAECARFGIDRRLGPLDQLAYALEVVTRMGPDIPDEYADR